MASLLGRALDGKRVIVTGAAGDIGRAVMDEIAAAGGHPVGWDRTSATNVTAVDVCDRAAIGAALEALGTPYPWGVVNAAGVGTYKPFLELEDDDWKRMIDINLTGVFNVGQLWAQRLVQGGEGEGAIVNVTSIAARISSSEFNVHYSASKGGAEALTRSMAVALARHGVRVNAVAPGPVKTQMNRDRWSTPGGEEALARRTLLGRLGDPVDIARAVVFLLSPLSAWTTGATLFVDGGITARN